MTDLAARLRAEVPRALDDLAAMVAIPSVSSLPEHAEDVAASAQLVLGLLTAEGVDARIVTDGGARPAVIGRKQGPDGAPTVLLYGHHDVQPTGDLTRWTHDPFALTKVGDRLLGRGSSDDKGAVALHLALLRAFGDELPVTLVFLVEGEEEIGSPGFAAVLETHQEALRADVVVVPDAVNPGPLVPSLTTQLRGIAEVFVELSTLTKPVHSGLYGGVLPCALTSLIQLIATLHVDGMLQVEGIGPSAVPPPAAVLDLDGILLPGVDELPGGSVGERAVSAPTVTVLALDAVPVADASNVLHATARVKLGIRVPPDGDPDALAAAVEAHLRRHVRDHAQLVLTRGNDGRGFHASSSRASEVWATVSEQAFGSPSVDIGAGGSIPFLNALATVFPSAEFLVTAVQDPGSAAHSYDETLHVEGFERAVVAHGLLLEGLSRP